MYVFIISIMVIITIMTLEQDLPQNALEPTIQSRLA